MNASPAKTLNALAGAALEFAGDEAAIQFQGQWLARRELNTVGRQTLAHLQHFNIASGTKVAFIGRNHPAALGAFVGILAGGYSVRMIYPFQSAGAIAREVEELMPAVVIADEPDFASELTPVLQRRGIGGIALDGLTARAVTVNANTTAQGFETPLIEILTSGTTGKPKPFTLDYQTVADHFVGAPAPGLQTGTRPVLLYFPIGNISGLYSTLPALLSGQKIVLLERFNLQAWRDYVVEYRPEVGGLPPAAFQMVLDADIPKEDLSSLKMMGAGAAPLDPDVQRRFEERYGIPILLSYGATEFGGPVTRMTPEMYEKGGRERLGCVGKAIPGAKLRVVDPQSGEPLPAGQEGILEVVSPRIGPEWIKTSDLALIDEEGFMFHRGRADGAIVRGGFKVLPETIERALVQHPAVSSAAVVGLPDRRLGQVPGAAVVLQRGQPPVTAEDLRAHLRERLLATYLPTQWRFVEELPRTALSFKVDQAAVKALFDQG